MKEMAPFSSLVPEPADISEALDAVLSVELSLVCSLGDVWISDIADEDEEPNNCGVGEATDVDKLLSPGTYETTILEAARLLFV